MSLSATVKAVSIKQATPEQKADYQATNPTYPLYGFAVCDCGAITFRLTIEDLRGEWSKPNPVYEVLSIEGWMFESDGTSSLLCHSLKDVKERLDGVTIGLADFDKFPELAPADGETTREAPADVQYKPEPLTDSWRPIQRMAMIREAGALPAYKISSSEQAKLMAIDYHKQKRYAAEQFTIFCLDTKNQLLAAVEITRGTLDASLVHPREIFAPALEHVPSSIILTHNHPSGDPTPSREDFAVTDRLSEAGKMLGVDVLDHIVVGSHTWKAVSIREAE